MNTKLSYLQDQNDLHTTICSCPEPRPLPHFTSVARLYELDHAGLEALNDLLTQEDGGESFERWLEEQKPQVYYGSTKEIARSFALLQACVQGRLVVNHLEAFPGISPLINALTDLLDEGYAPGIGGMCKCTSTHTREGLVCRVCYALLLCNVLSVYRLKCL